MDKLYRNGKCKKKKIGITEEIKLNVEKSEKALDENIRDIQIDITADIPDENSNNIQVEVDVIEDISEENIDDSDDDDLNNSNLNELKEKILNSIKNSPSGISLTKARKITGADKRKIFRVVNELLDNGIIQKNGSNYVFYEPSV